MVVDERLAKLDAEADDKRWYAVRENIRELRDIVLAEGNDQLAHELQVELEVWFFSPDTAVNSTGRTSYRPMIKYENGSVWPKAETLGESDWDYLEQRAVVSASLLVASRYADMLWYFEYRFQMARLALDQYMKLEERHWDRHLEGGMSLSTDWVLALLRPLELSREINDQPAHVESKGRIFERIRSIAKIRSFNGAYFSAWDAVVSRACYELGRLMPWKRNHPANRTRPM